MANKRILWIEDDADELGSLIHPLKKSKYEIRNAFDVSQALKLLDEDKFDLIILDMLLPTGGDNPEYRTELNGLKLLKNLRDRNINTPVIIVTVITEEYLNTQIDDLNVEKILVKGRILPSILKKEIDNIFLKFGI